MSTILEHDLGAIDVPNWYDQFISQSLMTVPH
jgi:hypothetical protein